MTDTIRDDNFTLYPGDCRHWLRTLPDASVDLIATDPPYGIAITANEKTYGSSANLSRKATNQTWDNGRPCKEIFEDIFRVSRNQIVFGANYFWEYFHASPCYIVWDKRGTLPAVPFSDTEFAWASYNRMPKKYTVINHGFIRDDKEPRLHPTQKPLLLMKSIILDFTQPGDLILDPFMGSGTTGVAALQTGRRFVGIELDENYFAIAAHRIADAARAAAGQPKQLSGHVDDWAESPLFAGVMQ